MKMISDTKFILKIVLLVMVLAIFFRPGTIAQTNTNELVKHFTRNDNVARVCHDIKVTSDGLVMVATIYGINYFNGYKWDVDLLTEPSMPAKFTRLEKDQRTSNKYYVGGFGKCGVFTLQNDQFTFKEIIDTKENKEKLGGNLTNIYQENDFIFFLGSSSGCIIYNQKTQQKSYIPPLTGITSFSSLKINDNIFMSLPDGNLFKISGNNWKRVTNLPFLIQKYKPVFFKKLRKNISVFISDEKRFYLKKGEFNIEEISTISNVIKNGILFQVKQRGNYLVILTNKQLFKFNLKSKTIGFRYTFKQLIATNFDFDLQGNVWVSTNNGTFYIELNEKFTFQQNSKGIIKSKQLDSYEVNFLKGGNLIEVINNNTSHSIKFDGFVSDVTLDNDYFIVSTSKGLYKVDETGSFYEKISEGNFRGVMKHNTLKEKHTFLVAGTQSIQILNKNHKTINTISLTGGEIYNTFISRDGVVYYATTNEVYQIRFSSDFSTMLSKKKIKFPTKTRYSFNFFQEGESIYIVNALGLFKLDNHKDITCLTAKLKGLPTNIEGLYYQRFSFAKSLSNGHFFVSPAYSKGNRSKSFPGILSKSKSGKYAFETTDFKRIGKIVTTDLKKINSNTIQIIAQKKLINCNLAIENNAVTKFNSYIREVFIKKNIPDSLQDGLSDDNYQDLKIYNGITRQYKVEKIPYNTNSISFKFASDNYVAVEANEYSYQLVGLENTWSNWSKEQKKEYTHLREGTYTFKVRCKNVYGTISSADSYTFTILPPWYRTTWAYLIYTLAGIGLLVGTTYGYGRYRSRQLYKRNQHLEQVVDERTQEILAQKEEITQQADILKTTNNELKTANDHLNVANNKLSIANDHLNTANEQIKKERDEKVKIYLEEATNAVNSLRQVRDTLVTKGADTAKKMLNAEINTAGEMSLIREKVRNEYPAFVEQLDQALMSKQISKLVWQVGHCLKLNMTPIAIATILPTTNRSVSVHGSKLRKLGLLEPVRKNSPGQS